MDNQFIKRKRRRILKNNQLNLLDKINKNIKLKNEADSLLDKNNIFLDKNNINYNNIKNSNYTYLKGKFNNLTYNNIQEKSYKKSKNNFLTESHLNLPKELSRKKIGTNNFFCENLPLKTIKFDIDSWSSYISNFHPKNICIDSKSSGELSKWSVDFKSQNEYVFLKLEKTSVISSITFGKFRDPTNLKEFKILAGLNKTDMIEILHSGLAYDIEYEPFSVKKHYKTLLIPCKYVIIKNQ